MSGLQTGRPAMDTGYDGFVHVLRKRITFADLGTVVTIGKIPAGAIIVGGGVHVITAFNSSGTDLLDVGFIAATTDADGLATDLDLATIGFKALDELAAVTNIHQTIESTITASPAQSVADATAGVADVVVTYVI